MIWIYIRHFFCIHRNANGFDGLHQTQNHEGKMSDDVTKEGHLKCHFSLFYHFFVTLIRIKSSHNAIYAINYCKTKVT